MANTIRVAACIGFGSSYGREVVRGIVDHCSHHRNWSMCLRGGTMVDQRAIGVAIEQWKAQGLLTGPHGPFLENVIRKTGIPTVEVSGDRSEFYYTVGPDNYAVGVLAAEHLLERGLLGYGFCGEHKERHSDDRGDGFSQTIASRGFECQILKLDLFSYDWIQAHGRISDWVAKLPKPSGVMACDDWTARQVIWACRDAKLRVPEDVAVIGVDNDSMESYLAQIPLSSVVLPTRLIGQTAARTLQKLLTGKASPPRTLLLAPIALISRQSTNAFGRADAETQAALRFIAENAHRAISIADILDSVPISRRRLERNFADVLKRSPGEEILRVHLEKAQSLLAGTETKIRGVAIASGFNSYTLFCRHFHKHMHMTPIQYRQKFRAAETGAAIEPAPAPATE